MSIAPGERVGLSRPADGGGGGRPEVVRVPLAAYLRAVWSLLWSAARHPTKTTEIDWLTGRVVRHF